MQAFTQTQSIAKRFAVTVSAFLLLFVLHFVAQYIASQENLKGLTTLHLTIRTTGEVRQLRELMAAQQDFLKKAATSSLIEDEKIVFLDAQKQSEDLFTSTMQLVSFRAEAQDLINEAYKIMILYKDQSREIINNKGDAKEHLLITGQYLLEIQDLLGKVQLVLGTDADKIVNDIYNIRFIPLIAGIIISLFTFVIIAWVSIQLKKSIEVPIQELAETTKVFANGNLRERAVIRRYDEIGMMAHAFNVMAAKLEDSTVSKAYVENILESMLSCVLVVDRENKIIQANRLTYTTFGYGQEELIGLSIDNIVKNFAFSSESDSDTEALGMTKARKEFPIFVAVSSLRSEANTSDRKVYVINDITENKKIENEIRERNLALSVANQELEVFSYSVSHDLRAPLRIIDGFSQALLEDANDKLDESNKNHLSRIRHGVQRMGQLIDAVLNLSRISRASITFSNLDLSALVKDVADEIKKSDPARNSEFIIQPNVQIYADPILMKVTMENLLGNAWKYSSKKEKTHIEFGMTKKDGNKVYFIRDNGAGFDMNYAQKLFMPFQRLHHQNDFPGTGIGLASVKRVIIRHGGEIWAESKINEGTTFYFTMHNS